MAEKTFHCTILTPERTVLDTDATFAAIPAHDGEMGILQNRAPLLCLLGIGIVRLETDAGHERLFVDAGFAEMLDNKLTILTEQAARPDEVDVAAEQAAESEARSHAPITAEEHDQRRRALARAAAKQKLARESHS